MRRRRLRAALLALGLAACGSSSTQTAPIGSPRLVVLLILDQWPEWSFEAKRAQLDGGGFHRLLAEGEWHVGEHPSAATLTCCCAIGDHVNTDRSR